MGTEIRVPIRCRVPSRYRIYRSYPKQSKTTIILTPPPKLLNGVRMIGKFRQMASHIRWGEWTYPLTPQVGSPCPLLAKLARWALPPWNPQQGCHPLHTGAHKMLSDISETSTGAFFLSFIILLRGCPPLASPGRALPLQPDKVRFEVPFCY